jgi:hypothetical protein
MEDSETMDDELKKLEQELAKLENEEDMSSISSPSPEKKDSTLVLFRELIQAKDSTKFGNLDSKELGISSVSVRDQLDIANYLDAEGLDNLSGYFRKKAEITLATSLSKKGKLIDNIVTQIKKEQKTTQSSDQIKKGMFANWGKPKEGSSE